MRSPGSVLPARLLVRSRSRASATVWALAHSRGNRAQKTRAHVRASGSARWTSVTSMPSESASGASERLRDSGAKRRASWTVQRTGGLGQSNPTALEGLPEHARVEAGGVGDEDAPGEQLGELLEHLLGRRRGVHHRLRDAGEALDPTRQRPFRPDDRVECLVQLAAADQHGAHLGELAEVAREAVGLGVDGEELGPGHGLVEQMHERPMELPGSDGLQERAFVSNGASAPAAAAAPGPALRRGLPALGGEAVLRPA